MALKAFLISLALDVISLVSIKGDQSAQSAVVMLAFGIGAAYIVYNLHKWQRDREVVRGAAIAWTVAVLLSLTSVGGLMGIANSGKAPVATSRAGQDSPAARTTDPREALLRDVKLDFRWSKEGFGNVMIADFTITNPTEYRFKDFEIKCTHYAPSGTQIDSNARTIYEIVEPKSKKLVRQMNMGFIHSQARRSACAITDLTVLQ